MYESMRELLEHFKQTGELQEVDKPVSRHLQLNALNKAALERHCPALLFTNVDGYDTPVVGGIYGSQGRFLDAVGMDIRTFSKEFNTKMARRSQYPVKEIQNAPVQEVVYEGEAAKTSLLPLTFHAPEDGAYYIASGVSIARYLNEDGSPGVYNASIHRIQVYNDYEMAIHMAPGDLTAIIKQHWDRNEPCPIAIAIGVDPYLFTAGATNLPPKNSELELAGSLKGSPEEVVWGKTVPLLVPAHAEYILEGWMEPNIKRDEGPYGETSGYYGALDVCPVIKLSAITTRKDPIYQDVTTGRPPDENQFVLYAQQARAYEAASQAFPAIFRDISLTLGGCISFHAIVSMAKQYQGQVQQLGAYLCAVMPRIKHVWVVDEDIDIHNPTEVEWAFATRFRGGKDLLHIPTVKCAHMNPYSVNQVKHCYIFDCTVPLPEEREPGEEVSRPVDLHLNEIKLEDFGIHPK